MSTLTIHEDMYIPDPWEELPALRARLAAGHVCIHHTDAERAGVPACPVCAVAQLRSRLAEVERERNEALFRLRMEKTLPDNVEELIKLRADNAALRAQLKNTCEKLDGYARRQGKKRMAGKRFGDGSVSNPNYGHHYPEVQSALDAAIAALAKEERT